MKKSNLISLALAAALCALWADAKEVKSLEEVNRQTMDLIEKTKNLFSLGASSDKTDAKSAKEEPANSQTTGMEIPDSEISPTLRLEMWCQEVVDYTKNDDVENFKKQFDEDPNMIFKARPTWSGILVKSIAEHNADKCLKHLMTKYKKEMLTIKYDDGTFDKPNEITLFNLLKKYNPKLAREYEKGKKTLK